VDKPASLNPQFTLVVEKNGLTKGEEVGEDRIKECDGKTNDMMPECGENAKMVSIILPTCGREPLTHNSPEPTAKCRHTVKPTHDIHISSGADQAPKQFII
jgi:hypothetical protein